MKLGRAAGYPSDETVAVPNLPHERLPSASCQEDRVFVVKRVNDVDSDRHKMTWIEITDAVDAHFCVVVVGRVFKAADRRHTCSKQNITQGGPPWSAFRAETRTRHQCL